MIAVVEAKRTSAQISEDRCNLLMADRVAGDHLRPRWIASFRKELQGAHAVATDSGEQAEGVNPISADPRRQATSDHLIVGKEVVEYGGYWSPDVTIFAQRQR